MTEPSPPPDPWQTPAPGAPAGPPPPVGQWGQPASWGPPPAPQQWGPPPPASQWGPPPGAWAPVPTRTNPWAITSLVTGILPLFLVAIPTGIVGIVQTRRRRESGTGLAIAGLVLGCVWGAFALFALIGYLVSGPTGHLGAFRDAGATTVGTCLDEPSREGAPYVVVDCGSRHDAEIYLVEEFEDGGWDEDELATGADDACIDEFKDYTGEGYFSSDYDYGFFFPDEKEWAAGEQRFVCVVTPGWESSLRGSVRDPDAAG